MSSLTPLLMVDDVWMGQRQETSPTGDGVCSQGLGSGSVNSVVGRASGGVQARDVHGDIVIHNHGGGPEMVWPHRVGVVPWRAGRFQDRAVSAVLTQAVAECETASAVVLLGLGGVGKTQLAADYAEGAWAAGEIDLLIWVPAGSRDAIVSTYATAATELRWHNGQDAEQGGRRFLAELAATSKRWLIVLDDLQSPGDMRGLWPPPAATGRVVVTTRRRDAVRRGDPRRVVVPVGVFTPAESLSYLKAKLSDDAHLAKGAAALADDLGHLPLALAQAAAYLIDEELTCNEYRDLLADRRRTLLDLVPEPEALPDDHSDTIAATWSLSIDAAAKMRPVGLAPHVLNLAAVLNPNGIPAEVFTAPFALVHLTLRLKSIVTTDDVRRALRCLHRLNLATVHLNQPLQAVRIHALVQRAVRERLTDTSLGEVAHAAADALLHTWPEIERDSEFAQVLRANADSLHINTGLHLWEPDAHVVLFRAGQSLGESGQVAAAVAHFRELLITAADHLGPDELVTLAARNNFASWQVEAGDLASAIAELEQLLTDHLRILGPDDPATLTIRSNIACCRAEAGYLTAAIAESEQLLTDQLRIFGADDPDTLLTRRSLASWRAQTGDVAAVAELEELLTDHLRILGADHPDTLTARNTLAFCRAEAGDLARAIVELQQLCTDRERILGPDHPETLTARSNLAHCRAGAGDLAGAIVELEQLCTDHLRILGADHPDTLTTRNNLADCRGEAGDLARAIVELQQLCTDQLRIIGPDHPNALRTRNNLASRRLDAGYVEAVAELEQLLTDHLRILGADHPDTLITRNNLAHCRARAGDLTRAIVELEQLRTDRERILGPDHPETLAARHRLANCRGAAGDVAAVTELRQLLTDQLRVLGADHPETLAARSNLAYCRGLTGDAATAELEQLLTDQLRILGPDHPGTLIVRSNLAYCRGTAGDVVTAITELRQLLTDHLRIVGADHPDTRTIRNALEHWEKSLS
ncbi:tetratricopeptide repeat protein [Amycolatopsis pigmentata]|uniref:Tetratricopeptide repeat protein n=1 Tax=Amycolatopsis pigmentata TaxID=450801 RepID=A0ABW5G4N1_9PSEU